MFEEYKPETFMKDPKRARGIENYAILKEFMNLGNGIMVYIPETSIISMYSKAQSLNKTKKYYGFPVKVLVRRNRIIFIRTDVEMKYPELL